jgi:hypothetical protein
MCIGLLFCTSTNPLGFEEEIGYTKKEWIEISRKNVFP